MDADMALKPATYKETAIKVALPQEMGGLDLYRIIEDSAQEVFNSQEGYRVRTKRYGIEARRSIQPRNFWQKIGLMGPRDEVWIVSPHVEHSFMGSTKVSCDVLMCSSFNEGSRYSEIEIVIVPSYSRYPTMNTGCEGFAEYKGRFDSFVKAIQKRMER